MIMIMIMIIIIIIIIIIMKENFINKFLNKIKFTINDQLMKDFARRFTTIKNISYRLVLLKTLKRHNNYI